MPEFVIQTAITVNAPSLEDAMFGAQLAMTHIPIGFDRDAPAVVPEKQLVFIENWWIAEDGRKDGSDNDSSVFVHVGKQPEALHVLRSLGLTGAQNTRHLGDTGVNAAYAVDQLLSIARELTSRIGHFDVEAMKPKLAQALANLESVRVPE